jgi:hypothetical protein
MASVLNIEVPEKIQGVNGLRQFIEDSEPVQKYLFDRFKDLTM